MFSSAVISAAFHANRIERNAELGRTANPDAAHAWREMEKNALVALAVVRVNQGYTGVVS